MEITKRDVEAVLSLPDVWTRARSARQQTDMLLFSALMDTYGADTILTWWRNCSAIALGETLPSPGRITDPRR